MSITVTVGVSDRFIVYKDVVNVRDEVTEDDKKTTNRGDSGCLCVLRQQLRRPVVDQSRCKSRGTSIPHVRFVDP